MTSMASMIEARDAADLAKIRAKWPELAKAGDIATQQRAEAEYRGLTPRLIAAQQAMELAADQVKQRRASSFGQIERDAAATAHADAVAAHDELLLDVQKAHAAAFPSNH